MTERPSRRGAKKLDNREAFSETVFGQPGELRRTGRIIILAAFYRLKSIQNVGRNVV
jgi:hypothetical protein